MILMIMTFKIFRAWSINHRTLLPEMVYLEGQFGGDSYFSPPIIMKHLPRERLCTELCEDYRDE